MNDVAQPTSSDPLEARFAHVDTWVFDLDNTLYPAGSPIWPRIDERITRYLADLFGLDGLSARALQKFYYQHHGTTLRGLMADHAVSAKAFLDFVHDIDRSSLAADPALVEAVASLPGRKLILTNGSRDHALRTAAQLGFAATSFEDVFDIIAADFVPKPDAATYDRFFAAHGVDPARAAMFEDIARNLDVPHARGMVTVLVAPKLEDDRHREAWERLGAAAPSIDFVTDDIAGFLAKVALARRSDV
ncbi:MAG TPA: pyrimidine 5'-nucleotidase [Lichenihabitans sp.]|jgi:putative hydrolase of the HAD superfamily|nr:pyrimidine 5'-nucleotidase [Lichenihabitans sp.]